MLGVQGDNQLILEEMGPVGKGQPTEHHKNISSVIAIIIPFSFSQSLHHSEQWETACMGKIKGPCCKSFQTEQNYVNTALHTVRLQPSAPVVKPQPNPDLWRKQKVKKLIFLTWTALDCF